MSPERERSQLRMAMNTYRRKVEEEFLVTHARLQAADLLAAAVEAIAADQPEEVRAALRAYREAGR